MVTVIPAVISVAEMIREAREVDLIFMRALLQGVLNAQELDSCLRALVEASLITREDSHVTWIGPVQAHDPAGDLLLGQGRN